ncbi:unnamed protein product [Amoebophrya sp. A25]|nr:unnamed protein product [Amoebophrya sp. A25]|eukprot:GSA25T00012305001.1
MKAVKMTSEQDGAEDVATSQRRLVTETVFLAGAGFMADSYDLFVIDFVLAILTTSNTIDESSEDRDKSLLASASIVAAVVGQLSFGFLADWFGRRVMFITTCVFIVAGCVGQSLAGTSSAGSLIFQLVAFRLLMGLGIGGEYPLAATVTSEKMPEDMQKKTLAMVFSMQGWGQLLSVLVIFFLLLSSASLESTWRLAIFVGCIPTAIVSYFRWKMHETPAFSRTAQRELLDEQGDTGSHLQEHQQQLGVETSALVESSASSSSSSRPSFGEQVSRQLKVASEAGLLPTLAGTALSWFLLDVTFYGVALFKADIGRSLYFPRDEDTSSPSSSLSQEEKDKEQLRTLTLQAGLIVLIGLPGYLFSIALVDRIGLRRLQFWGFISLSVLFFFASATSILVPDMGAAKAASTKSTTSALATSADFDQYLGVVKLHQQEGARTSAVDSAIAADDSRVSSAATAASSSSHYSFLEQQQSQTGEDAAKSSGTLLRTEKEAGVDQATGLASSSSNSLTMTSSTETEDTSPTTTSAKIGRLLTLAFICLTMFVSNFGPNATTYILPAVVYPTPVRATCHGISAAMGKLGAAVGVACFSPLLSAFGLPYVLRCCGCVALVGAMVTHRLLSPEIDGPYEGLWGDKKSNAGDDEVSEIVGETSGGFPVAHERQDREPS